MPKIHFKQPASRENYIELIRKLDLKPPVIIKPNWGTSVCFTEAEIIDWTLEAIDGDAVVTESYGWARTEEAKRVHIACNQYAWSVFYRREGRDFNAQLDSGLAEFKACGLEPTPAHRSTTHPAPRRGLRVGWSPTG